MLLKIQVAKRFNRHSIFNNVNECTDWVHLTYTLCNIPLHAHLNKIDTIQYYC